MSMKVEFRTVTDTTIRLAEQRSHNMDFRVAQQSRDSTTGQTIVTYVKHVAVLVPKKLSLGTIAPSSPADASGEYSVSYFATYLDNKKVLEIDPFNFIFIVNGIDYLADVRKALGK